MTQEEIDAKIAGYQQKIDDLETLMASALTSTSIDGRSQSLYNLKDTKASIDYFKRQIYILEKGKDPKSPWKLGTLGAQS